MLLLLLALALTAKESVEQLTCSSILDTSTTVAKQW